MRSIRLGLLEIRRVFSVRKVRFAICILALVPLLYGGLYLWAFFDPYSRLDKIPIAVVDLDTAATVDGQTVDAGRELVDELMKSDTLAWKVTTAAEARQGLEDRAYYLALTIPEDFSASLASADGSRPVQARLQLTDSGSNILVAQISQRVVSEVRAAVSEKASAQYFDRIYVSFSELHQGLQTAAASAGQLSAGIASAATGSKDLQNGLETAASGADRLDGGMSKLAAGSSSLQQGAQALQQGAATLATKLTAAAAGAETLAGGLATTVDGAKRLMDGSATLTTAGGTLDSSAAALGAAAQRVQTGAAGLADAAAQLSAAGAQVATGTQGMSDLLAALAAQHPELKADGTFVKLQTTAAQTVAGSRTLAASLATAATSAGQLAAGTGQLGAGAGALSKGVSSYVAGVGSGGAGVSRLYAGLAALATGGQSLAGGLNQAQAGAAGLAAGATTLASGAASLGAGIAAAGEGMSGLSAGLDRLEAGSVSLADGLAQGASGSEELTAGLDAAAGRVPDDTEAQRRAATAVLSAPVALDETALHTIPNYGTGFAPYFIPLALWVGALMTYFLIRAISARALASTASDFTVALSGFWPAAAVTAVQAVILMLVLQFALGIHPTNVAAFYLFPILLAVVSAAIMQFLSGALGTAGKFIAVVLLMLQLTSSAGTFPLETIPRFFQVINPFLPMTYGVLGLRQAITSGDLSSLAWNAAALVAFGVVALAATVLTVRRRRTWTMEQLKPLAAI